jgi:hypothetical protein
MASCIGKSAPFAPLLAVLLLPLLVLADEAPAAGKYFRITIVDEETGRGVPLVELRTVNDIRLFSDSNGIVAFHEPGLMNQQVFFHVASHGYEFPRDGFGFRGKALAVSEGGRATLSIKRRNLAERLYRVTGAGIYRDSVLVGERVPLRRPVLNGLVLGSDSVVNAVYHGKIYWFWGDTNQAAYPLGNFNVPGAVSLLPGKGGLDPERGVELDYFLDDKGFARPMAPLPGKGPTWINGLVVLRQRDGRERMFAAYVKVRGFLEVYERGLAEFRDDKQQFEKAVQFPLDAPAHPGGHPFLHSTDGVEHVYFTTPYPLVRVRAVRIPSRGRQAADVCDRGNAAEAGVSAGEGTALPGLAQPAAGAAALMPDRGSSFFFSRPRASPRASGMYASEVEDTKRGPLTATPG